MDPEFDPDCEPDVMMRRLEAFILEAIAEAKSQYDAGKYESVLEKVRARLAAMIH